MIFLLGHGVDGLRRLVDLHIECEHLDGQVHDDGQQGGEQGAQNIVLAAVLADLDNLGDDEAHDIHPCDGAGEGETSHYGVQ